MNTTLPPERLLAIIDVQNEIAASALDVTAVMELVVERARWMLGASAAVIELAEGEEMVYHVADGMADEFVGYRVGIEASLSGLCQREGAILHCEDASVDPRVDAVACRRAGAMSLICVPLFHGEQIVGVLKVYDPEPLIFDERDIETLDLLSGVIGAHMAHAEAYQRQRHESRHDALTGLPNWRAFDEALGAEIARARRHPAPLAVGLLDLDGFKAVNDAGGHAAGNELLRAVAAQLARVREEDSAFRLGGDEFALLLVDADETAAQTAVRRIVGAIERDPACQGIRVSYGTASRRPGDDQASMLGRADAAMYAMKTRRRQSDGARA